MLNYGYAFIVFYMIHLILLVIIQVIEYIDYFNEKVAFDNGYDEGID